MPYPREKLYDDAVQVWHSGRAMFGSGRLIGRNLILTARHVITPESRAEPVEQGWKVGVQADCRETQEIEAWTWIDASVVWFGRDKLDLALIKVQPKAGAPDFEPKLKLRIGQIDQVEHHPVRSLGFPRGSKVNDRRMLFVPSGKLDDERGNTLSFGIDQEYQPEVPAEDWRGFSGSAVLLAESPEPEVVWIYGVVQHVPQSFTRRLAVARLSKAWEDESFRAILVAADVSPLPPADPSLPLWKRLTWDELEEKTMHQIDLKRESVRSNLRVFPDWTDEDVNVRSSLVERWSIFIRSKTWKENCLSQIQDLLKRLNSFDYVESREITNLLRELAEKLRQREPYIKLRGHFTESLTRRLLLSVSALRKRVAAEDLDRHVRKDLHEALSALQSNIAELTQFGKGGVFRKCFLVMGGIGSGKTHFITDVLAHSSTGVIPWEGVWLPIWIQQPTRATEFKQHLLHTVQTTTRIDWPSLEDFLSFVALHGGDSKVVVIIDRLHSWIDWDGSIVKELAHAIEDYTRFDQLHWLICINDRAYGSIAPRTKDIWAAYCDDEPRRILRLDAPAQRSGAMPRSGGWYRLDVINEQQELGLILLRNAILRRNRALSEPSEQNDQGLERAEWTLDKIQEVSREVRRELSSPLIAQVLVAFARHSSVDLGSLVDARFIDFVRQLRDLLVERSLSESGVTSDQSDPLQVEQAIDFAAQAFATSDRAEQPLVQLQDRIMEMAKGTSSLANRDALVNALSSLDRAHLVEIFERETADNVTRIKWIALSLELFWEFHLARQRRAMLVHSQNPKVLEELLHWLGTFQEKRLMSGVAQFLLVLLDADGGKIADELWRRTLAGEGFPLHSGLFAASRALLPRQRKIAEELLNNHVEPRTPDELVALVSFAHLAANDAATVPQRVAILHPHFEALGRVGLGSYCAFALSYLITEVNKVAVMQKVLPWLEGSEMLGAVDADRLADLCIEKIAQILGEHDSGGLVDVLLVFAHRHPKLSSEYERSLLQNVIASQAKGRDRYLFRHWLFDHGCHRVARERKAEAYSFLWKRKWYGASRTGNRFNVDRQIASEMEKFANFAIGDISQGDRDLRRGLVALVHELVESEDPRHRENAYYLIRHSEPIPLPGVPVIVNEDFRHDLREIAQDSRLEHLLRRSESIAFLKANLGNTFPLLTTKRDQFKKRRRDPRRDGRR